MKTPTRPAQILDTLEAQHPGRRHRAALLATRSSCWSRPSCRRSRPTQRVNLVTPALFKRYPDARALAKATPRELEPQIHSTGFFRAKSKALIGMAQALVAAPRRRGAGRHGGARRAAGRRPQDRERRARPRARRARACRSIATCCASRTASASPNGDDPVVVEQQLCAALPPERWTRTSDTLILHGRRICRPKPLCEQCAVRDDCDYYRARRSRASAPRRATARTRAARNRRSESRVERAAFERLVADALAIDPARFRNAMQNIAIVVEDEPSRELLREMEIEPPDTLLGLYQGMPLTERHWDYGNALPDRILLFQGPHERDAERRGRSRRRDRRDADPRDRPLLRPERRGDRRDRRAATGAATMRDDVTAHRPRKRFGQHFLEPAWVDKVVARDRIRGRIRRFIEIGPGRGALTRPLAARAQARHRVRNRPRPGRRAAPRRRSPNVTVVEGDFLDVAARADRAASPRRRSGRLRVAGNLPYNVASPILFKLVELYAAGVPLLDATVMLQREVADRLLAAPGTEGLRRAQRS